MKSNNLTEYNKSILAGAAIAAGAIMPTTFIPSILIVTLGNSIGSLLFRFLTT